jgi:hypothetical protein
LRLNLLGRSIDVDPPPRANDRAWFRSDELSLLDVLQRIGPHAMLAAVQWLLAEQRVVLVSAQQSLITSACQCFIELLYPLQYLHTFIALVPRSLRDCLQAPTPYLMGVQRSVLDDAGDLLAGCVIVDLDTGETRDLNAAPSGQPLFQFPAATQRQILIWLADTLALPSALADDMSATTHRATPSAVWRSRRRFWRRSRSCCDVCRTLCDRRSKWR